MSNQTPIPNPPALSYERAGAEPIPGVFRDSSCLVVPRGGDISAFCYCCGKPSAGRHITQFLRASRKSTGMHNAVRHGTPFILDLIILVLGTLSVIHHFFKDSNLSGKRRLTFGFCPAHHRKRLLMKWGMPLGFALGIATFFLAMRVHADPKSELAGLIALGAIFGAVVAVFSVIGMFFIPGPKLEKENADHLWISGAGDELMSVQARLPK